MAERPDNYDFDAWRAAERAKRRKATITVFGQKIPVPTAISLDLSLRVEEADLDDRETLAELVAEMYGAGELERWRKGGCSVEDFALLLAWGSARAQGDEVTFEQAAEVLAKRRAELMAGADEGKVQPNRAERRASRPKPKR